MGSIFKKFLQEEWILFKSESNFDKLILILYSVFPVLLIIGTALSELLMIFLCLCFLYLYFFKKIKIFDNKLIYGLGIIYIALLINLIFSNNMSNSLFRNIFFIKYLIFTLGTVNFFSNKEFRISFLYKIWILIITIFAIDMYIQFFFGKNIIGIESPLKFHRVSGFMGDELKAGSLILSLSLILSCFLINDNRYKNVGLALIIFFLSVIFISGDRSNFIKSLVVMIVIIFFFKKELLKKIVILFSILFAFIFLIISNYNVFKERYKNQIFKNLAKNNYNLIEYIYSTEYGKVYYTGITIFLNNKSFGVGNKNFRLLCIDTEKEKFLSKNNIDFNKKFLKEKFEEKFRCNTHPHQIYIEILSEHGAFGFVILIILLSFFIKQNFLIIVKTKNLVLCCQFMIILINFFPFLPGGSFFTSFNATLFWINIALFYSYKNISTPKKKLM